ncbi:MAG: hypothetical protein PVH87_25125 [Desulfobacteraceae bacterium]
MRCPKRTRNEFITRALITSEVERKKSLVPQIRESVSAYAGHEAGTYEKVIRERSAPVVEATGGDLKMDQSSFPFQALADMPLMKKAS